MYLKAHFCLSDCVLCRYLLHENASIKCYKKVAANIKPLAFF